MSLEHLDSVAKKTATGSRGFMMSDALQVRGARTHNLPNVDVDIPRNRFVVITGVNGSGQSSLASDTLLAEGQRQYVQSQSLYARQFFEQMERPGGRAPSLAAVNLTAVVNRSDA